MSKAVIVEMSEGFTVSLKCDNCNFALTQDGLPKDALIVAEELLAIELPLRHTCKSHDKFCWIPSELGDEEICTCADAKEIRQDEQEEIIKLLDKALVYDEPVVIQRERLIALIKGETK
jgi:hypothetical protein